jgi:tetratricopeptide (TPR) repeat protein
MSGGFLADTLNAAETAKLQRAREALLGGRVAAALPLLRELAAAHPTHAAIRYDLGNALADDDWQAAMSEWRRAAELAPWDSHLLILTAHRFEALRQHAEAGEMFARAVEAAPASVDALVSRAVWLDRAGRPAGAQQCARDALAMHPGDDQARYVDALLTWHAGDAGAAEQKARDLIASGPRYPYVVYAVRYLLAQIAGAAGQTDEAARWLMEAKQFVASLTDVAAMQRAFDKEAARRRQIAAAVTDKVLASWQRDGSPAGHALLAGHPRSGTTLIERVLGAHSGVTALDEPLAVPDTALKPLSRLSMDKSSITFDILTKLNGQRLENMRAACHAHLLREVPPERHGTLLLDKNPSLTALLPLWLRLFPSAPVIIALRDPRDVVLSCWFQNLPLNRDNANFLTLERTAEHYAAHMDVWLQLRGRSGLNAIETRYEDTVAALPAEGARLTSHLGLTWEPQQAAWHEQQSNWIAAPTVHDAAKPLYRSAVGRWRAYARHLEPVLPRLEPYIRAFGYEL